MLSVGSKHYFFDRELGLAGVWVWARMAGGRKGGSEHEGRAARATQGPGTQSRRAGGGAGGVGCGLGLARGSRTARWQSSRRGLE